MVSLGLHLFLNPRGEERLASVLNIVGVLIGLGSC